MFVGAQSVVETVPPPIPVPVAPDPLPLTPSEILQQIGGKLRQLREEQNLSLEDLSVRTQLQPRSIAAIETGHLEMLPEHIYVRGMVKRYGDSLGLDGQAISQQVPTWETEIARFEAVTKIQAAEVSDPHPHSSPLPTGRFNFGALSPLSLLRLKTPVPDEPDFATPTPRETLQEIGAKLRQLREEHQLSIEDLSARTSLQPRSIKAIEAGDIEMLPEPVYVKSMVKRYGDSLGVNGLAISQQVPTWEPEVATFDPVTKIQVTGFNSPVQMQPSQATGLNPPLRIKPFYIYLGYTLAILAIGALTSHSLNDAIKPLASTLDATLTATEAVKTSLSHPLVPPNHNRQEYGSGSQLNIPSGHKLGSMALLNSLAIFKRECN